MADRGWPATDGFIDEFIILNGTMTADEDSEDVIGGACHIQVRINERTYEMLPFTPEELRQFALLILTAADHAKVMPEVHRELMAMGLSGRSAREFVERLAERTRIKLHRGGPHPGMPRNPHSN